MSSAFSVDFLEPTSDFQKPNNFLISGQKIARKILVIKLSGFAEVFIFSTPAPVVSVLAYIAHYATSLLI